MIRIVLLGVLVLAVWLVGMAAWRFVQKREVDWAGVAGAIGFVALAFWLRHVTGMG